MLDHVTIGVSDLERSKAFYDKALKAIGIERLYSEGAEFFGYGSFGPTIIRTTTGHLSSIRTATTSRPFAAILRDRAVRN